MRISLRAARINAGYTQEAAGKALNVAKKTIGLWEKGKTKPTIDKVEPICNLYGVKYDDIEWCK